MGHKESKQTKQLTPVGYINIEFLILKEDYPEFGQQPISCTMSKGHMMVPKSNMIILSLIYHVVHEFSYCLILTMLSLFLWFYSLHPSQQFFSYVWKGLPVLNQYKARINVSCSRALCSDASKVRTGIPSISNQAFYH